MKRIDSYQQLGERYRFLRVIALIFTQIGAVLMEIGALLLVLGLYALFWGKAPAPPPGAGAVAGPQSNVVPLVPWLGAMAALYWSVGLLLSGLQLITLGTLCRLLIHVEENTRASAQILDKIRSRLESSSDGVEPIFRS